MTRSDFELIAAILREARGHIPYGYPEQQSWNRFIDQVADQLSLTNPNFKRERFIEACNS